MPQRLDIQPLAGSQLDIQPLDIQPLTTLRPRPTYSFLPKWVQGTEDWLASQAFGLTKRLAYDLPKSMIEAAPIRGQSKFFSEAYRDPVETAKANAELERQIQETVRSPYALAKAGIGAVDPTGIAPSYISLGEQGVEDIKKGQYGAAAANLGLMAAPFLGGRRVSTKGIPVEDLPQEPKINIIPEPSRFPLPKSPRPLLGPGSEAPLPKPPKFLAPESGRAINLDSPATIDIFGQQTDLAGRRQGRIDTPGLFNPKQPTLPPVEALPKTVNEIPKVEPVQQPTIVPTGEIPQFDKYGSKIVQGKVIGSTEIPRKPSLWERFKAGELFGGDKGTVDIGKELELLGKAKEGIEKSGEGLERERLPIRPTNVRPFAEPPVRKDIEIPGLEQKGVVRRIPHPEEIAELGGIKEGEPGYGEAPPRTHNYEINEYGDRLGVFDINKPDTPLFITDEPNKAENFIKGLIKSDKAKTVSGSVVDTSVVKEPVRELPTVRPPQGDIFRPNFAQREKERKAAEIGPGKGNLFEGTEGEGLGKESFDKQWDTSIKEAEKLGIDWKKYDNLNELQWDITRKTASETIRTGRNPLSEREIDKPQEMRVRPGGFSGGDTGVIGQPTINPATGRPNIAMGGADPQVLRQLGTSLYTKDRPSVLIQELMQNTDDEMKISGVRKPVRVAFVKNTKNPETKASSKSIVFQDFGRGMKENQLYNEFSDVGKSGKRNIQGAAGGFGFAKAAPFLGGDYMRVESVTIENGKKVKYTFAGKPEDFLDQEVGVPLHSEIVNPITDTGMRVEVFFPQDKYFQQAQDLLKTITEASPQMKDIESLERYNEPDTLEPSSVTHKWTKGGATAVPQVSQQDIKVYHGKPLPSHQADITTPENDASVHYDLDDFERRGSKVIFLNNGVYYFSEQEGASLHGIPYIPDRIIIDVKSKVPEGHAKYPFPANREGMQQDVKHEYMDWIENNVFKPARDRYNNEVKRLYDSTKPMRGNKHIVMDSEGKYTPAEYHQVETSPTLNKVADIMGTLLDDLNSYFDPDEVVATTEKYGYRIADPGKGGMNITDPTTNHPNYKTIVSINPFDALYSGMEKNWQYNPRELEPAEAARRFVHLIKHEFTHNLARNEGSGFTWAFSQVDTRFPKTTHYESQIFKALTDRSGNYVAEIPELLRRYIEARKRPGTKEDILARQAAGIENEGGGKSKRVSRGVKSSGKRTTGGPKLDEDTLRAMIDKAFAGTEALPEVSEPTTAPVSEEPNWGGEPKVVTIGGKGRKFSEKRARAGLNYEPDEITHAVEPITDESLEELRKNRRERGDLESAHKEGVARDRVRPIGGAPPEPPKPPKPPTFDLPEPPDEPFKGYGFGKGERVLPSDAPEGKSAMELLAEAAEKAKKAKEEKPVKGKKAKVVKTVQEIIDKKKAESPVTRKKGFKGFVNSLPKRFRDTALYKSIYEPLGVSSLSKLRRMGNVGERLAQLLKDERTESNRLGGQEAAKIREVRRSLSKEEQLEVVKILDGQKDLKDASSQKVRDAYKTLRQSTEYLGDLAEKYDVKMKSSSGKTVPFQKLEGEYFPHRYPEELFRDPKSLREKLIKAGNSPAAVDAIMKRVIEKGERFSSAQHARDFNLPGYLESLDALEAHQYEMARAITRAKKFGALDVADPASKISKLIKESENPAKAQKIVNDYLSRSEGGLEKGAQQSVYNRIVQAEVLTKLSQFGITNMGDLASLISNLGVRNTLNAIKDVIKNPHGSADIATRTGAHAILRKELLHDVQEGNLLGKAYGTTTTEKFNRTVGALAGRVEVQRLFDLAKKDKKWAKTLSDFVEGDVNEVLKQDKLTPEQIDFGGSRGVELSSGYPDKLSLSKAMNADNPLLRLPFLFKRFSFLNTRNIVDAIKRQPDALRKAKKIATILAVYQLAGEGVGDTKKLIEGLASGDINEALSSRGDYIGSGNKVFDRIMANYLQSALFGIAGDVSESLVTRKLGKVSGTAAGPLGSDLDELAGIIGSATQGNYAPAGRAVLRRIPYIGSGLEKRFNKKESSGLKGIPAR